MKGKINGGEPMTRDAEWLGIAKSRSNLTRLKTTLPST